MVKVGIGPGSVCITRLKTGVGYPQLNAVMDCREVCRQYNIKLCSDGGHRSPGDVAKSFAAGADYVMLGGMLSGTFETGLKFQGNAFIEDITYRTSEGKQITHANYKGPLSEVVKDILGGLRSACAYVGAKSLSEFREKAEFVRVR